VRDARPWCEQVSSFVTIGNGSRGGRWPIGHLAVQQNHPLRSEHLDGGPTRPTDAGRTMRCMAVDLVAGIVMLLLITDIVRMQYFD
jgi:hypothetical protein